MTPINNNQMKLYIFHPSESWRYCGGAILVLAKNYKKACKLVEDGDVHESEESLTEEQRGRGYDNWVLVEVLNCPDELEERVVLQECNWA